MIGLVLTCYVLAVLGIALAVCIACRRPRVLLSLGGLITTATGAVSLYTLLCMKAEPGDLAVGTGGMAVMAAALPLLAAGLILLIGGAVRQGQARETPRTGPQGDPSEPAEGRGSGTQPPG